MASVATELIAGKTIEEALSMSGSDLSAPLGALPPMKIHCAQLVEGALRSALTPPAAGAAEARAAGDRGRRFGCRSNAPAPGAPTFSQLRHACGVEKKVKVVLKTPATPNTQQPENP